MNNINNQRGIIFATIIGVCVVLGAITVSSWMERTQQVRDTTVPETAHTVPERNLTISDTGDWQQTVLDTRPSRTAITLAEGEATATATPDSLTKRFGVAVLRETILAETSGATPEEIEATIANIAKDIVAETKSAQYTTDDINVVRTNDTTTRTYLNEAADTLLRQERNNLPNELELLERALRRGDTSVYTDIAQIAHSYEEMRDAYLEIPVPISLQGAHLQLVNVFTVLHDSLMDMSQTEEDPLRTYVQLQRYPSNIEWLRLARANMAVFTLNSLDIIETTDSANIFLAFLPEDFISQQ